MHTQSQHSDTTPARNYLVRFSVKLIVTPIFRLLARLTSGAAMVKPTKLMTCNR